MEDELHPAQIAAYRRMTPAQKLEQFHNLYWMARRLKACGIRSQHPDWSEEQIQAKVREVFLLATT